MEIKAGEIIREKREQAGYSLVDFAHKLGISPGYLSQLENGRKANPKLDILLRIINELDIDIDMLFGLESTGENLNLKIPSLLRLTLAKDRNCKVLEDRDIVRKLSGLIDKLLDSKYIIEDNGLYGMFLEDIFIQTETVLKRYLGFQVLRQMGSAEN